MLQLEHGWGLKAPRIQYPAPKPYMTQGPLLVPAWTK